jgi:hypothetical protein
MILRFTINRGVVLGFLLILTSGLPLTSRAASVVELSLDQLIERSDLIVLAQVLSKETEWSGPPAQSLVLTYTEAEVLELFKGDRTGRIFIRAPGGSLGGYNFAAPGWPALNPGQEFVFFLRDTRLFRRGKPVYDLIGLEQASLPVLRVGEEKVVLMRLKCREKEGTRKAKPAGTRGAVWVRIESLNLQVQAVMKNQTAEKNSQP